MARLLLSDLDRSDLRSLTAAIVQDVAPDESDVFNTLVENYIDQCQSGLKPARKIASDEFHFGVSMEVALCGLHIVAGTLALIEIMVSAHKISEERLALSQIQKAWQEYLERAGLTPALAKAIPIKFGAEMIKLLEKAKARRGHLSKKSNA